MAVISVSLPKLLKKEVDAIVESGRYENKSELLREALRAYLHERRDLRLGAALYLYEKNAVSLGRAAEIAELNIEEMKEFIVNSGIKLRKFPESVKEAEKGDRILDDMTS